MTVFYMYWISQQPGNQTSKPSATSRVLCGLQIVYGVTARQSSIATLFKNHKKGRKINSISCGLLENAMCLC